MQLITLAHHGEAQSIIEGFNLKKISDSLFKGEAMSCLLTGEGPFEAAVATAAELKQADYQEVINLGICGALSSELEIGSLHEIRSLYLAVDGKPQFRSFPVSERGVDLLTSFERILDPKRADILRGVAKLVDREAWGVAFACKEARIPFRSFKMVSDVAGSIGACELVRETAQVYSQKLAEFLKEELSFKQKNLLENEVNLGTEFYFTFSSSHHFHSLVQKLRLLKGTSDQELIKLFPLDELRAKKMTPKERAKSLLEMMEDEVDPFRGKLKKNVSEFKKPWEEKGIRLHIDPRWEDEKIQISFDITRREDLMGKLEDLRSLDLETLHKIFKGEVDVE